MTRRLTVPHLMAVLAVLVVTRPAGAFFGGGGTIKEGSDAPVFRGQTIDNRQIDYAQLKGKKVVVLDFWSIYCASCIEEMPRLVDLHNEFKDKGLVMIGVNLDSFGTHRVVRFMDGMQTKINFPVLIDKSRQIATMFNAMVLPTTLVIDGSGKVRFFHVGYKQGDERQLRDAIVQALKELKKQARTPR